MRKFTLLALAAMVMSLLGLMLFFAQPSTATSRTTLPADLSGGGSIPYLPPHMLEPMY
jgi:hypothetical protein